MLELITRNKQRSAALLAGAVGVPAVVGLLLGLLVGQLVIGVLVGLLAGGAFAASAYLKADTAALEAAGAQPADSQRYQRLHNLVEGLCVANGLSKPKVYVVDDPALNSFAVGREPKQASLVVTTGLLEQLDRVELEGVVAHELAHIRNLDIQVGTLAVRILGVLPGSLRARLLHAVLAPQREIHADVAACQMTRFPPGLIAALEKVRSDSASVRSINSATAHLWLVGPIAPEDSLDTHPVLEERIALLREL